MAFARVMSAQPGIPHGDLVSVETDVSRGLHAFSIVGLPDKAVEEARDRVAATIKHSGFISPKSTNKKIVVSLAPAALKKEGASFDVPIALSYLLSTGEIAASLEGKVFAGELALDGSARPIKGALSIALVARGAGLGEVYVPRANAEEAALVEGISVYGFDTLSELIGHLSEASLSPVSYTPAPALNTSDISLEDIRGQAHAKRGLMIAAAGGHNIAFYGPPGTGKTLLARTLASLLPPLTRDEMLEVTVIHSVAGELARPLVALPPFRAPHHSASYVSLVGGGAIPKPGEVTLAHRGVLFLDEFPEFRRDVINALRQPMEDKIVSVSRARGRAEFPANFILVAALNPCPCGHFGSARCTCLPSAVERYRKKISGPIADRIDMWLHVAEIPPEALSLARRGDGKETEIARRDIESARRAQSERYSLERGTTTNSDLTARTLPKHALISPDAQATIEKAAHTLRLSPRGYHRTIKVARTIADLAKSKKIEVGHMLEALQYRPKEW